MIAQPATVFAVEFRQRLKWRARWLLRRHGNARHRTAVTAGGGDDLVFAGGPERRVAHAGAIRVFQLAVLDFLHAREALHHHFHVRMDDRFAKSTELLLVLLADGVMKLLFGNAVVLEERGDAEEGAQKRIALHAELEVGAVSRFARDLEARQDVDAQVIFFDEFSMPRGDALPGGFGRVARFPNQTAALVE